VQAMMTDRPNGAWWRGTRVLSGTERAVDAAVHGAGLLLSLVAGSALLVLSASHAPDGIFWALVVYVSSLVLVLAVSLAFNLWPRTDIKRLLARLDQAAIFLFIAGTYTPFLSLIWGSPQGLWLTLFVWSAALVGISLKLFVPQHFGRIAILLYLLIGWSGIIVFQTLAAHLPPSALWLLLAGGAAYSCGIVFHLWEKMKFYTAVWHLFVVVGAGLHLIAVFEALALSRWVIP